MDAAGIPGMDGPTILRRVKKFCKEYPRDEAGFWQLHRDFGGAPPAAGVSRPRKISPTHFHNKANKSKRGGATTTHGRLEKTKTACWAAPARPRGGAAGARDPAREPRGPARTGEGDYRHTRDESTHPGAEGPHPSVRTKCPRPQRPKPRRKPLPMVPPERPEAHPRYQGSPRPRSGRRREWGGQPGRPSSRSRREPRPDRRAAPGKAG
mmetsp:Transcript_49288/g.120173  ORF Transcript_49288/g.120173 Transcript_49288/m.120173 type:complete len:209 (+) Transcript_49288:1529-2155(+)